MMLLSDGCTRKRGARGREEGGYGEWEGCEMEFI
jgi:hypothetical protein